MRLMPPRSAIDVGCIHERAMDVLILSRGHEGQKQKVGQSHGPTGVGCGVTLWGSGHVYVKFQIDTGCEVMLSLRS